MAAGAEYRDESVSDVPDDQFQRGLIFGTEAVSAAASRDSWAAFVEFAVPVLDSLELSLAARYDDYSDFGDTTNPKVAVRWAPIESLAFRASWGTGFRAPSLAQIGLGPSQESQFFIDTFGCTAGVVGACSLLDYNLIFSGNPNLKAEESETLNLGVAWKPVDSIEMTLDYWKINQDNKIDEVPFGFIYRNSCGEQSSTVCTRGLAARHSVSCKRSMSASSTSASRTRKVSIWAATTASMSAPAASRLASRTLDCSISSASSSTRPARDSSRARSRASTSIPRTVPSSPPTSAPALGVSTPA
jgi:outer membrane receptor for ferrienterochelin and colicin